MPGLFSRLLVAVALSLAAAPADAADTVSFTLDSPVQQASASGGTVNFYATVRAPASNAGNEFLNGDAYNLHPSNGFGYDDSGFFDNFPFFLVPGQSYHGLFFTLTVPAGTTAQAYTGTLALLGGPTDSIYGQLASVSFEVDVAAATAVPEPATWAAMILGMATIGALVRRRRGAAVAPVILR